MYVAKRHQIAKIYDEHFAMVDIELPLRACRNLSALHLYVILVDEKEHQRVFHNLRDEGIGVNLHYIPVHTQPYYQN